jgi:hypothetical protein
MLPLLALLLRLFFKRSGRVYLEHLVFALHQHAFYFFLQIVPNALNLIWLTNLVNIGYAIYLWLSLRTFYGTGRLGTTLRLFGVFTTYGFLLSVALAVVVGFRFLIFYAAAPHPRRSRAGSTCSCGRKARAPSVLNAMSLYGLGKFRERFIVWSRGPGWCSPWSAPPRRSPICSAKSFT